MVKLALAPLTLALLGAAAAACSSPDSPAPPAGAVAPAQPVTASFEVERSFSIAASATSHLAFPSLAKLGDGSLLLVYREGASHADPSGRIVRQVGAPDASAWSTPEVLLDTPGIDDRDPSVAVLPGGDVVVSLFQHRVLATPSGSLTLYHPFVGRSRDGGASFGPFVAVDRGTMTPDAPARDAITGWTDTAGAPIEVAACSSAPVTLGGRLVLATYGGPAAGGAQGAGTRSHVTLYASDDGASWAPDDVLAGALPSSWVEEPALLPLASGATLLQARTAAGAAASSPGKMVQATSGDAARSWSAPVSLPFVGHAPELAQLSNGLVLSGFRELDDAYTSEWASFAWSLDDGASWSDPVRVADCGGVECGYPAIVELDASRFLYVWYAPGGTAIQAAIVRFTLG